MRHLLDTSATVALTLSADSHHQLARRQFGEPGARFHTTSVILGETYTFLRRRVSFRSARETIDRVRRTGIVTVHQLDADFDRDAWLVIDQFAGVPLSYADASLVVLGRRLRIHTAFSFDSDLAGAGLELVPR